MANEDDYKDYYGMAIRMRMCLDQAWAEFASADARLLLPLVDRTKAGLVADHWLSRVRAEFQDNDVFRYVEIRGQRQLVSDKVRVRAKKMDRKWRVAQNRTAQSASWITLPLPGIPALVPLHFGYRPDPTWTRIEEAGLACQVGKQVVWYLEVGPFEEDTTAADSPTPMGNPPIRVKPHVSDMRQAELNERKDNEIGNGREEREA